MDKQLKYRGRLALLIMLVMVLLVPIPVYAAADDPVEDILAVEEIPEEVVFELDELVPEIVSMPVEPPVEEIGELLLVDLVEETFTADEPSEDTLAGTDAPAEVEPDTDETIPEAIADPAEQAEEDIPVDESKPEASDEGTVELPPTDLEDAVEDLLDEPIEFTEESTEQVQDVEETIEIPEAVEEPAWTLSIPGSQAIAYKAERTEIGTIAVKNAKHFADGQAVSVTLEYSSFNSNDYSIPIVITVIQNGTEFIWNDGTSCSLKPDGSDPITVYVNVSAEAWDAAPHGSYAMSIQFRSALLGR